MRIRRVIVSAALAVVLLSTALPARAWIYPEHRAIAGTAIEGLTPQDRAALDALWAEARAGHEARLCDTPWAGDQGQKPGCLDWSAWPAIAGDHSCSAGEMLETVLESDWILKVAGVCSRLEVSLATAKNPRQLTNRLVRSDLELQRADKAYATRAGANNVHFLLSRMSDDPLAYMKESVKEGSELNGIGVWVRAHLAAMRLAHELGSGRVAAQDRPALARRALALEAFGFHFLEDSFASGHVAGTWGDVAVRKGTHDYYNEHGLDTRTWDGTSVVLYGDARMRPQDRERAATSVKASLSQLVAALSPDGELAAALEETPLPPAEETFAFDSCTSTALPAFQKPPEALLPQFGSILKTIPVPGRSGEGSLPRFRAEVGPFAGIASSLRGAIATGGLDAETSSTRWTGTMDLSGRIGLGLDALLGEMGDGQIFLQAGISYSSEQTSTCKGCTGEETFYGLFPRMPARTGISTRIRIPFWLIPGDLLVATPILAFTSPQTLANMGITAANGGVIPWQAAFSTFLGRMQFCLGREVGATFYGYSGGEDNLFVVGEAPDGGTSLVPVALRSIDVEAPVLEFRPFRDFSTRQATSLVFQLGVGADFPTKVTVLPPSEAEKPDLSPSWYGYVKMTFDWRRYF